MRVIAGKARSMPLKTLEGRDTRPTTDRIKETLFNILQNDLYGCKFLDLFAGSGQIGIEALSRGAKISYFVENNKNAAQIIRDNLNFTKLADYGVVMECDAATGVRRLQSKDTFDIIFMDPPYKSGCEEEILTEIVNSGILNEDGMIVIEAELARELEDLDSLSLEVVREKTYKTNKHLFIKRK